MSFRSFWFFIFTCLAVSPSAQAFLDIRALGMLNLTDPTYKSAKNEDLGGHIRGGIGLGALVGFKIFPALLSIESGAIFAQRKYALDQPQITQSWNYVEVPIGARLFISDFNLTGGFFFSKGFGSVEDTDGDGNKSSDTFDKKKLAPFGLGVYLGGAYDFDSVLYTEVRVAFDLKNHSASDKQLKFTNYEIMIGARFDLF